VVAPLPLAYKGGMQRFILLFSIAMVVLAVAAPARAQDGDPLAAAPSRYAKLDGHRIHYKVLGQGKTTLALVHGWSCDGKSKSPP